MKWYPNYVPEINQVLSQIFEKNKQADKTIQSLLKKQRKWGSRDRKFVAKVLYDIVRWKNQYEFLAQTRIETKEGKKRILSVWSLLNEVPVPDYLYFSDLNLEKILKRKKNISQPHINHAVPLWLYQTGVAQLGEQVWQRELSALNTEADVVIRANTLKISPEKLQKILKNEGIISIQNPHYPHALFIKTRHKLTGLKAYQNGLFEIQDASSQLVAPFTGIQSGMTLIDACAGAGGKTLHIAALMQNKGNILAYDIYQSKIDELKQRAKRNGVKIIKEAGVIDTQTLKNNYHKADILLIDAPCSSIGTLRRKPGLKWELSPQKIKQINVIQKDILQTYESMLKPGGNLIYVTCSIFPEENEKMINTFLQKHKNYTFVSDTTVYPSAGTGDGFYMAKLYKQTKY